MPTFSGSVTADGRVYSGSPLTQTGTFTSGSEAYRVLARATNSAGDVKYYVISRSGSSSVLVLNGAFAPVGNVLNLGSAPVDAAVTPDGRKLLLVTNTLRIYNTDTDTESLPVLSDVGLNPDGVAVSYDSRRAFVVSSQGQSVVAVDLATNTRIGQVPLPGITTGQGSIAAGPNGMIYVSAADKVFEVDPRVENFNSSAVRRQFLLPGGTRVGKLHFTRDGTRALAVNNSPQSGHLLFLFSLDFRSSSFSTLPTSTEGFQGFLFEKIFIGEEDRAFLVTSAQSSMPRRLYSVTLPDPPSPGVTIGDPVVREANFASYGTIPIVDSVAFSPERPNARRMYVSAPLNLIAPAAANTILTVQLNDSTTPNGTVGNAPAPYLELDFVPGPIQYAGPASTVSADPASGVIAFNTGQPNLAANGTSLPIGVQVIGSTGTPLFNFPVTFTSTNTGVQIVGGPTVNTNASGIAYVSVKAPATAGDFSVSARAGNFSRGFTFTVTGSNGGGNGGGGDDEPGTAGITVISGNGQLVKDGEFTKPIVVEVRDQAGNPVPAGTQVTWTVTQGAGNFQEGTSTENNQQRVTTTDADGRARNQFLAGQLPIGSVFVSNVITVTSGGATATVFATTHQRLTPDGNPSTLPTVNLITPAEGGRIVGKTGQTITGGIRVQVFTSASNQFGTPIPNIGITARVAGVEGDPDNDPTRGPAVECTPNGVALTTNDGVGTCDLRIFGRTGSGQVILDIGGYSERRFLLQVNPGDPSRLVITNGNNQSGKAGDTLPAQLEVALDDGGGNVLSAQAINWAVVSGTATLTSSTTSTNQQGRTSNTVRLGNTPGPVQVRATAVGGTQPSVTFNLTISVTVTGLVKISGDPQSAFTNANFANPLVVEVRDSLGAAVPGQNVTFSVASGSATLTPANGVVTTGINGQASVQVRAGANAGPIVINAVATGAAAQSFNLTAMLPGPLITPSSFYNAASGERGGVVPGSLYIVEGQGLAPELNGCVTAQTVPGLGPFPTRLNNVEVQFGSVLAPLLSVCRVNNRETVAFQAPFELAPGGAVAVTVRVGGGSTLVNNVQVLDFQPGTFVHTDAQNRTYAVALKPNGTYVTPENPARWGEEIRVYITGAGQVTPTAFTGVPGAADQLVIAPVVVGLNESGVRLVSATYWEGMIGVYEVTFEVPANTQTGAARPLGILLTRPGGQFVFPGNSPMIAISQ